MTARATIRKADVARQAEGLMKAALRAGLPVGSFEVVVEGDRVRLLPAAANEPLDEAAEMERRIRGAFSG